jgi:hypothetical protein
MVAQRQDLVAALTALTGNPHRARARRFLLGLSADELQFIAEFLGSSILESGGCRSRSERVAQLVEDYHQAREENQQCCLPDRDHKILVLLEFLCRIEPGQQPLVARAGRMQ